SNPMLLPPPKRPNAQCTSFTIALACATQSFTPRVCAPPPASSRLDARWGSGPASNAPACTGPSTAQTPSSPCAAPNSADALRTSGSAAPTGLPHDVIPQNRRAPPIVDPVTRVAYPGNKIPVNQMNPAGLAMMNFLPLPNRCDIAQNANGNGCFTEGDPTQLTRRNYVAVLGESHPRRNDVVRLDGYATSKLNLWARYVNDYDFDQTAA